MTETRRLPLGEFIALVAMMFATTAFSIDAMLAALPAIASDLTPDATNRAQLVITSFVLGMGLGTFVTGPLADRFGRKRVILGGLTLYAAGAALASVAGSLELMLAARVLQGLGVAGPRIATLALVRDLYSGRQMARVVSFAMLIFTLVPAVAPAIGSLIIAGFGWRAIFAAFILFAVAGGLWIGLRQPETLPPERRKPLRAAPLMAALREVLGHRVIVTAMSVQALFFGILFGTLSSAQPIVDQTYGRGSAFPYWFAVVALLAGSASLLNASLVVRLGMRFLITVTLTALAGFSAALSLFSLFAAVPFALFIAFMTAVFFSAGLTLGNLNALALEPVGHIAGTAASLTTAIATVLAVALAAPIGLAFDGTALPLTASVTVLCSLGVLLMRSIPR
ncbi:MAG: multidrug effflux MFS transporter [Paracoccaceae bacterium]